MSLSSLHCAVRHHGHSILTWHRLSASALHHDGGMKQIANSLTEVVMTPTRTKHFAWTTIEQPGDFFRIHGDLLIEECDGYEIHWRILNETGTGVQVALIERRYN